MRDEAQEGHFLDGPRCPKCNCALLINSLNLVWCSFVQCDYGLNGHDVKYVDGKLVEVEHGIQ